MDGRPSQVPLYPGTNWERAVKSRFWRGKSSICFRSTVVPIALVVVSTNGAAPPLTSTVWLMEPTWSVAEMSVVWAACTTTSVNTCVWKPLFETVSLYFPRERLTKVCVPFSCVSPLLPSFVVRSRSSSCAPWTTLPVESRTVTVTVPSEPCWAQINGTTQSRCSSCFERSLLLDRLFRYSLLVYGGFFGAPFLPKRFIGAAFLNASFLAGAPF